MYLFSLSSRPCHSAPALPHPPLSHAQSRSSANSEKKKGGKKKQQFSQEELNAPVTVTLRETSTVELFNLAGYRVFLDSDLHRAVTKRNERYNALFEKHENVVSEDCKKSYKS